jgi:virginiamycin A acetyltransferase
MPVPDSKEMQKAVAWARERERRARCGMSPLFQRLYSIRLLRPMVRRALLKLEGGQMFSATLREVHKTQFGTVIGKYSYGPCLKPGILPRGTIIGNYCSLAEGLMVFRRNHPIDRISLHPFFFNRIAGVLRMDTVPLEEEDSLTIGHDVWVGANAIIVPGCKSIGNGAVVGAGTIVTKDIPPFAVVAGNPGRIIRWRFPSEIQAALSASAWWLRSLPELLADLPLFTVSATNIDLATLARIGRAR